MPGEIATICFNTQDAVHRKDGSFRFNMPSRLARNRAVRVALASCEFPIVQRTIEPLWNRLYYHESIRLDEDSNVLEVERRAEGPSPSVTFRLGLPARFNKVLTHCGKAGSLTVRCARPHHLFVNAHTKLPCQNCRLVGLDGGDLLLDTERCDYIDEHTFCVHTAVGASGTATLWCDSIPSAVELCRLLTACAQGVELPMRFEYVERDDIVRAQVFAAPPARTRVLPGLLGSFCGLSTVSYGAGAVVDAVPGGWFGYVNVPCGFYGPCHRSMSTGPPMHLPRALERALNPLYLPLLAPKDGEAARRHVLVFVNPSGTTQTCSLPPGRYDVQTLCAQLTTAMCTAVAELMTDVQFSVIYEAGRVAFHCERRVRGHWIDASFGLLFHHPLCLDAEPLGFANESLQGHARYTGALLHDKNTMPHPRNLLRVTDVTAEKRFRVHASVVPTMIGGVVETSKSTVTLRTHVNGEPFAHGFRAGDVVRICSATKMKDGTGRTWRETAVQLDNNVHSAIVEAARDSDATRLCLRVSNASLREVGTCIQIVPILEAWNLHFARERSIPSHVVGFPRGAVLWDRDGSNAGCPPYDAPYVHSLDHPDYVCLTFSESSSTAFEHSSGGITRPIFCKLSLYPLFREERMLPRDTELHGDDPTSFTLSFWNPDMVTPYYFHGAEFSFSLAFFSASH